MRTVSWILACYPRCWRERYQEEMTALLEQHTITPKTIFDLLLGAFDAQIDPHYRSKEGFMFRIFHDMRWLSYIYISALAIFLMIIDDWLLTTDSLTYQESYYDGLSFPHIVPLIAPIGQFIVIIISFCVLFGGTVSTLREAFKNRNFATILFALLCLGLSILIALQLPAFWLVIEILLGGMSLFMAGIKGLKMLRNRRFGPVIFAILIALIGPAILILCETGGRLLPLPILVELLLGQSLPYISLGALMLILADASLNQKNWNFIRGVGIFLALLLVFETVAVVIWDVSCWIAGNGSIEIFGEPRGIETLFGGQGLIALVVNAIVLFVMLALVILALLRAFIIHPDRGEGISEQLASV